MTEFTGPLRIRALDSDTIQAAVSAGGSATFASNVNVSGNVRSGGASVVLSQRLTAAGATGVSGVTIPAGGSLLDVIYHGMVTFGSAAGVVDVIIGTTADDDQFGRWTNVSGRSALTLIANGTNVSGAAMRDITARTPLFVKTTATSGARSSAGRALLNFLYTRG